MYNFLIQSDFSKHVKPVAVVPEPEPDRDSHTPEPEIVENLIDTEPLRVYNLLSNQILVSM